MISWCPCKTSESEKETMKSERCFSEGTRSGEWLGRWVDAGQGALEASLKGWSQNGWEERDALIGSLSQSRPGSDEFIKFLSKLIM